MISGWKDASWTCIFPVAVTSRKKERKAIKTCPLRNIHRPGDIFSAGYDVQSRCPHVDIISRYHSTVYSYWLRRVSKYLLFRLVFQTRTYISPFFILYADLLINPLGGYLGPFSLRVKAPKMEVKTPRLLCGDGSLLECVQLELSGRSDTAFLVSFQPFI
jgi:hypothetical protein